MEKKARKVFDLNEQQAKDVLAAIKAIVPVISLIREWGKAEQELSKVKSDNLRLRTEVESLEKTTEILSDSDIVEKLKEETEKKKKEYQENNEKKVGLKEKCEAYEDEVICYQDYAEMFSWIDDDVFKKTSELSSFEDEEEILAMAFLLLNSGTNLKGFHSFDMDNIIALGWNDMLRMLKANEL